MFGVNEKAFYTLRNLFKDIEEVKTMYNLLGYKIVMSNGELEISNNHGTYMFIKSMTRNKIKKARLLLLRPHLQNHDFVNELKNLGGKYDSDKNLEVSFTSIKELKEFLKTELVIILK